MYTSIWVQVELDRWEGYIIGEYLVGDTFTLADIALGTGLSQLKRSGLDYTKFPKLAKYLERLEV